MRTKCFELWAVRNLIVHRSGIADRRFVELCPRLDGEVGKPYRITAATYAPYLQFAKDLMVEIFVRDLVRCGIERSMALTLLESQVKSS